MNKHILVLIQGFVYVGDLKFASGWAKLTDAYNIRQWGTKNGLGELALKGPQSGTILDPTGTVNAPLSAIVCSIECKGQAWQNYTLSKK